MQPQPLAWNIPGSAGGGAIRQLYIHQGDFLLANQGILNGRIQLEYNPAPAPCISVLHTWKLCVCLEGAVTEPQATIVEWVVKCLMVYTHEQFL